MNLEEILHLTSPLPNQSLEKLVEIVKEVKFPKNHLLIRADRIENKIYLVKKGILRAYASTENHDITFWFGKEGDAVISMNSYTKNIKGYENIELLEDAILYQINNADLQTLYQQDIHMANWGRKLAEQELVKAEERLISRQFKTATERYHDLLLYHPELLRRVQLGHIASYLGITQVSLSRIRSEIK